MENKTGKYLKYAIGEIILVVVGILIALSINNWNTSQQNQIKEIGILEELKKGLIDDKNLLLETLKSYKKDSVLLHQLDSLLKIPTYQYSDDLNTLFGKVYGLRFVRLNNAFYEDLKSTGLQLINDKNLRVNIVNLFETNYKLLEGYLEMERSVNQVTRPYYLENFTDIDFNNSANPIDYQKIWADPYFRNIVHYRIITLNFNQLKEYRNTINDINKVVIKTDLYLKKLK